MVDTTPNPSSAAATGRPKQHTLAAPVTVSGKGLLLGEEATITIQPAPPDHGIVFERTDVSPPVQIPALVQNIARRARRTTLALSNTKITKARVLDANGMPVKEVPLATSAGRKTLKFPGDALYVVLE